MIHYTPKTCAFSGNNYPTADEATFAQMIANKEPLYEVTMNDKKAKYYFDIDLYAEDTGYEFDRGTATAIEEKGKQYINEALTEITGIKPNIAIATSHGVNAEGKEKYSVRYWVSNMMDTKANIKGFVQQLNKYILAKTDGSENIYEWIDPRSAKEVKAKPHKVLFDEGVYSSERKMRCVNTSKPKENRPLIMKEGTIEQTIITGCFDEDVVDVKCVLRPSSPNSVVNVETHSNTNTAKMETDIYYKYLNCIGNKMCDRGMYNDTITILQILKNENLDIKYVKYWIYRFAYPDSKKYTYAIDNYDKYIKYTPLNAEKRLTIKSLKYFAKKHNPTLYSTYFTDDYDFMIRKKYPTLDSLPANCKEAEADFANLYYEFKKDRIHYKNENIYLYYNDEWNIISDKGRMVKNDMYEFYLIYFKVWLDYINDFEKQHIENTDKKEEIKRMRNHLEAIKIAYSKNCNLSNTYQMLLNKLACVKCSIIFDVGPDNYYNIHFKNGVYELRNRIFRSRLETDYVTKYLDYDYLPLTDISKETQDDVLGFFNKVQPNKEQRDFTLGYLAYCLTGDATKQIFKMNIGHTASNGKSTELSIHEKCFKNYTQKIDNKVMLLNFEKRHKHLVDLISQPIRLVYFEEMPKGKKLDVEFIKDFVDGKNISCEIMFGTKEEIKIQAKLMSVSNHDFQVDTDAGILRRGRVQKYESKFISKDDGVLDEANHIYEKIEGFENKFDNILYKNAYFHLLLNYIDKLVVPNVNKEEFKKTAEDNDSVLTDILDGFIVTNNHTDCISRNDIDLLCGTNKNMFGEYKSKLQGMGCKYNSQERYNSSVKGVFTGIKKLPPPPSPPKNEE